MLIFLSISCILSIFINDIFNALKSKNSNYAIFPLLILSTLQVIVQLGFAFLGASFLQVQIITYVSIFSVIIGCIIYIVFKLRLDMPTLQEFKHNFWKIFKSNVAWYVGIIAFSVSLLFQFSRYEDTGAYYEISNLFRINITTPLYEYISSASYYVYSVLGDNYIPIWYNYFTPLIFYLIFSGFINTYISKTIHVNKCKYLVLIAFHIFLFCFSLFITPTTSSGNLYIHSCLIGVAVICILTKKWDLIWLCMLAFQFFSLSGSLISVFLSMGWIIYMSFYLNWRRVIRCLPFFLMTNTSIVLMIFASGNLDYNNVMNSSFKWVSFTLYFLFAMVAFALYLINKLWLFKKNYMWLNNNIIQYHWTQIKLTKIVLIILTTLITIFLCYYFYALAPGRDHYSGVVVICFYIAILPLCFYNFWKNFSRNSDFNFLFIILTFLLGIAFLGVALQKNGVSSSFWRLMFLLPTIGIGESTISYIIILFANLYAFFDLFNWKSKGTNAFFIGLKYKGTNACQWMMNNYRATAIGVVLITILVSCVPFAVTALLPKWTSNSWTSFSINVQTNLNLYTKKDVEKLNKLNASKQLRHLTYAADTPISAYLTMQNDTALFYQELWKTNGFNHELENRNWYFSQLNFFDGKYKWEYELNERIIQQSAEEFAKMLSRYIIDEEWVDVVFLSKITQYFTDTKNALIKTEQSKIKFNDTLFNDFIIVGKTDTIDLFELYSK